MASNYTNSLYKDYEKAIIENEKLEKANAALLIRATIAEDNEARLQKQVKKLEQELIDLREQIIKNKDIEIQKLQKELERLKVRENNDGTNFGIPTSMTPINKKKVISNFAKNTGGKIGRKEGHKKDKLNRLPV